MDFFSASSDALAEARRKGLLGTRNKRMQEIQDKKKK
jgi:hypothetical protein